MHPHAAGPCGGRLALFAAPVLALMGGLSLWLGQDLNFDLLNYHYYAGYAFLHGRTFHDLAPAGSQSFLPPLLNVFHYLGIAHLPPRVFGFLLGTIHGLNALLLFALGLSCWRATILGARGSSAVLAAVVGSLGPAAVSLLGTTFGDNLVSIPPPWRSCSSSRPSRTRTSGGPRGWRLRPASWAARRRA